MSSTPLTLAALATSAVPGLQVVGVRAHTLDGGGAFNSAVIITDDAELIVRVPRDASSEVQQSAEMLGLAALADGARTALPFGVSETLGMTRAGDTRAVVSTFLPGGRIDAGDLEHDALLLQPIADALAAIHQLPTSLVQQAGLPMRTAEEVRESAVRLVARAAETRLLPDTVHARWLEVLASARLWDFAPTVIH
ncbi:MAG: phosphotransferase, partial [Actinobacteria bacterium]|nr:phosphotransferase [Actinomycetota bacterium]